MALLTEMACASSAAKTNNDGKTNNGIDNRDTTGDDGELVMLM